MQINNYENEKKKPSVCITESLPYHGTGLSVPLPLFASLFVAAILSPRLLLLDNDATSFNKFDIL